MDLILEKDRSKKYLSRYDIAPVGYVAKSTKGMYYLASDIDNPVQENQPDPVILPLWGFVRPNRETDSICWIRGKVFCAPWKGPIPCTQGNMWGYQPEQVSSVRSSPHGIYELIGITPAEMIKEILASLVSYEQEQERLARISQARNKELHAISLALLASGDK